MEKKVLYLDCYSGISGDMMLGALLDCGVDLDRLRELLSKLGLSGYILRSSKVVSYGLSATEASVIVDRKAQNYRYLPDILQLLNSSSLPHRVKEQSIAVFQNLAKAESAVHDIPVDKVHFHEVGAIDAIVDIVGSVGALYLLGVDRVVCSPLPLAGGTVQASHGLLPLPAPATLKLLQEWHVPVYGKDIRFELVTPTGAALAVTLAEDFGPSPLFVMGAIGYGAGKQDPGYPNFLRLMVGKPYQSDQYIDGNVQLVEANIDDMNHEILGYLIEKLFDEGALDVYYTAIQMKKNRPAVKLGLIVDPRDVDRLLKVIFQETSTLGVRILQGRKVIRPYISQVVETSWGPVRVKLVPSTSGEAPEHFAPEYDDCLEVVRREGVPLKEVYRQVECIFYQKNCAGKQGNHPVDKHTT